MKRHFYSLFLHIFSLLYISLLTRAPLVLLNTQQRARKATSFNTESAFHRWHTSAMKGLYLSVILCGPSSVFALPFKKLSKWLCM